MGKFIQKDVIIYILDRYDKWQRGSHKAKSYIRIRVDALVQNLWKIEARDYAIAPWATENIFSKFLI